MMVLLITVVVLILNRFTITGLGAIEVQGDTGSNIVQLSSSIVESGIATVDLGVDAAVDKLIAIR